ncbi:MAG TPA: hypothetical protein PLJ49_03220 [Smithella sp.]|nr:hypothetical protein [Smithella sp.]HOX98190.1 hypothetical protein [Smithella sp.]HPL46871.1 hypothetical protein [Smithella sp.]
MKGPTADPPAKIIKAPHKSSIRMIGRSQNFFLTFKKPHTSLKKSMFVSRFSTDV